MANWKDIKGLPTPNGQWESYNLLSGKVQILDRKELVRQAANWSWMNANLFATPQSDRFLPPPCLSHLSHVIWKRVSSQSRAILALLIAAAVFYLWLYFKSGSSRHILMTAFLITAASYNFVQGVTIRAKEDLAQQSLWTAWLIKQSNWTTIAFVAFMLLTGLAQTIAVVQYDGVEPLVVKFGMYYPQAKDGEYWRIITGPFIHSSFSHWSVNLILGAIAIKFASALDVDAFTHFFGIVLISTIITWWSDYFYNPSVDAFVGVSGGIFGLFGALAAYCFHLRENLPKLLWAKVLIFAIANLFAAAAASQSVSNISHISGLVIGVICMTVNQMVGKRSADAS